eukprot:m.166238 g.166238  ORF g.166238 m.166238 type:complete len:1675 (-) comp10335_c1_seq23:238-5262(-)
MRHRTSAAMAMLEITESDDLATLTKLDEQVLVDRLHERYDDDKIYTYIGDILVAVNPFRPLLIYENAYRLKYRAISRGDAPPHIFAVADQAYHLMSHTAKSQCCVVSGESGAGKTESAKFIIRHIIDLCPASTSGIVNLEKRILQVNPLLEAFGNAQTNMNDNSSRFGKYTELVFDSQGAVMGAYISEYLLEQSRVISQQEGEQNFHIFYYLFSHKEASKYMLDSPDSYSYLRNPEGLDEDTEGMLEEVMQALSDIGFSKEDEHMLFAVLSSVLHLGNIHFKAKDELDPANIHDSDRQLKIVCELLRIDEKQLRSALTCAVNVTRGEKYERRYTTQQAYDARDALAKALYGRIFSWLVVQLNKLLCPPSKEKQAKTATKPGDLLRTTIGILDIYGFENFGINSFEQLCINLANEQLQQFFNQHVFELELEEYEREGIDGAHISYVDNKPLLAMFLDKPIGLFKLLDEESLMPKGSDNVLVQKYKKHFESNDRYLPAKNDDNVFSINHYAGKVTYHADGFLDKNRNMLASDIVGTLQASGLRTVSEVFLGSFDAQGNFTPASSSSGDRPDARGRLGSVGNSSKQENTAHRRNPTLATIFKSSLAELVAKMTACRPHFVRCIKPNTGKSPWNFQDDFVMIQLNYTGMLETTRIRREGYAVRPKFGEFIERYKMLGFGFRDKPEPTKENCEVIMKKVKVSGALLGKTKVFLKYFQVEELDSILLMHHRMAAVLQQVSRGGIARKHHRKLVEEAKKQKEEAEKFVRTVSSNITSLYDRQKSIVAQDLKMQRERREQAAEMARKLAEKRHQEKLKRATSERELLANQKSEMQKAYEHGQREFEVALSELSKWKSKIQSEGMSESMRAQHKEIVSAMEEHLRQQQAQMSDRINGFASSIAVLKQRREDLEAKIAESEAMRESIARQLSIKAEQGDNDGVSNLQLTLRNHNMEIADMREDINILATRLAKEQELLEFARSTHEKIGGSLNDLGKEEQSIADAYQQELVKSRETLQRTVEKIKAEGQQQVQDLESQLAEKDRIIAQLQNKLKAQQDLAERSQAEHERAQQQLKQLLSSAEAEVTSIRMKMDQSNSLLETTKNESSTVVTEMKRMLQEKEDLAERSRVEHEKNVRQLESKLTAQREEHEFKVEQLEQQISHLKSDIQAKEAQLRSAMSEKETAVRELSEKVERGEAEAASALRVQLRAQELKVEEAMAEVARAQSRLASQQTMVELTKNESDTLVTELKRLLAEKEDMAERRREEHNKTVKELNLKIEEQQEKLDKYGTDFEDNMSRLKVDLQQKDRQLQAAQADKETVVRELTTKVELVNAEVEAEKARVHAKDMQLEEARAEVLRANQRLSQANQNLDEMRDESDRALARVTSTLREKEMQFESARIDNERTIRGLEGRLEAQAEELEKLHQESERTTARLQEELEEQTSKMASVVAEKEEKIQKLQTNFDQAMALSDELHQELSQKAEQLAQLKLQMESNAKDLAEMRAADEERKRLEQEKHDREMADMQEQLKAQDKKRQASAEKLAAAIKAMGRKRPGSQNTPREEKTVDLVKYMSVMMGDEPIPADMSLSRFACKGFLEKLSVKAWQKRWFVFDLQSKQITWYMDSREFKIQAKGNIPLFEITKTVIPKGNTDNDFLIVTKKRTYHMRAATPEMLAVWTRCINSVVP